MTDDDLIAKAQSVLLARLKKATKLYSSSEEVRKFLQLEIGGRERECFGVMFLNARHQLIEFQVLFYGTVDRANVYPREVFKKALELNAAALILAHNHPSQIAEPSQSDIALTEQINSLAKMLDMRVLDHVVTCGNTSVSLSERGLM